MAEEAKEIRFRLPTEEHEMVERLAQYARKTGHIKKDSFQEFCVFAINVTYSYLKDYDRQRRGLK